MNWLDDMLKSTRKTTTNLNSLGDYSPLSGFENEQYSSKNPYQQILSSAPKEETQKINDILNTNYLKTIGMNNWSSNQISNIPDIPIDSTFYNRKDIYDLKQRLNASGIEIPEQAKNDAGLLTRFFNIISAGGQAVTTGLYNALDGDENTKFLKGLGDGFAGSLTSDESKIKRGSDLVDLVAGERTGDEGFGEKAGRFVGGLALDILLDPTTYLTGGLGALTKGKTVSKVGTEVTQEAVENAIKGINSVAKGTKNADKVVDLTQQAKKITETINKNNVKNYKGLNFTVPFTTIEKEIISADKIAEISRSLGIDKTIGKGLEKSGEAIKNTWNFKKSEDGIRASLEALPKSILKKLDTNYELKQLIKNNPLEYAKQVASKEVKNQSKYAKELMNEENFAQVKTLIEDMKALGKDTKEISSLMEKLKTHNVSDVLKDEAHYNIFEKFINDASRELDNATKTVTESERAMRKRAYELLNNAKKEFDNAKQIDDFIESTGAKPINEVASETEQVRDISELDIKRNKEDVISELKEANPEATTLWELYADKSKSAIEDWLKLSGMKKEKFDDFLDLTPKQREKVLNNITNKQLEKITKTRPDGTRYRNIKEANEIRSKMSQIRTSFDDMYKTIKRDMKNFNEANNVSTYVTPHNTKEVMDSLDEMIQKNVDKTIEKADNFTGIEHSNIKNPKEGTEILPRTSMQIEYDNSRSLIETRVDEMFSAKDQMLRELGHSGDELASEVFDKMIHLQAENMLANKSKYHVSPKEPLDYKDFKNRFSSLFDGQTIYGDKSKANLKDLAKLYGIDDISQLTEGSMKSIYGRTSILTDTVEKRLRNDVVRKMRSVVQGRGIDSSMSKGFDHATEVLDTVTGKKHDLEEILSYLNEGNKGAKRVTIDNLPSRYKVTNKGGVMQLAEQQVTREFAEKYHNKVFSKLSKEEQQQLMRRAERIADDLLENEYFMGNKNVYAGQDSLNFNYENVKDAEKKVSDYFSKKVSDRQYLTNGEYEGLTSNIDGVLKQIDEALENSTSIEKLTQHGGDYKEYLELDSFSNNIDKEISTLKKSKGTLSEEIEKLNDLLRNQDITPQERLSIGKKIDDINDYIKISSDKIDELRALQKEVKIKSSKLNKYFDELDITPSKNTNNTAKNDLNTRPITIPEDTPNKLREVFSKESLDFIRNDEPKLKYKNGKKQQIVEDLQRGYEERRAFNKAMSEQTTAQLEASVTKELPSNVKYEKPIDADVQKIADDITSKVKDRSINDMKVPELRQMLKEYGIKNISKSNRKELLEIADIVAGKNARIGIDLSKKTADEIQTLFKQLGINDAEFDKALERFTGAKKFERRARLTKDSLETSLAKVKNGEDDIARLTATIDNLFGESGNKLYNTYAENMKKNIRNLDGEKTMKTPIELIRDNKEIVDALGGTKEAEDFIVNYTEYMRKLLADEKDFGLDVNSITTQGYVPRRMSDEALKKTANNTDLNVFLEAYFRDRKNLRYNEQKFMKARTGNGTSTIAELNEAIYKKTLEEFGEEGAIKNFFERDLARLMIQRTYEHGNAFYDFKLKDMYLDKMGVKLGWAKGKDGSLYNIVENATGSRKWVKETEQGIYNDFIGLLNKQDYKSIRNEIENFMPNENYLPDGMLEKVKKEALDKLDKVENYKKVKGGQTYEQTRNELFYSLPQRAFARELKEQVKQGNVKLVYPKGESADITVNALKDESLQKNLKETMWSKKAEQYNGAIDYTELTWEDFEKINMSTKNVPVYAIDSVTYDAYQKAMTEQFTKDKDNFLKVYDKFTNVWKKMATTSVGFHVRNAFGNAFQMYLDVGAEALNPKWLQIANEVGKDSAEVLFKSVDGVEYTGKMVNDLFKQVGLDDVTQLSTEFNKARKGNITIDELINGVTKPKTNPIEAIFNTSQKVGDNIEKLAKRQQFSILLERGYSPLEAKQHVDKFLFDYSDLTDFETDFMKRIIPFYTFAKKNMELQIDTLLHNPTPVKNARRILDNQRKVNVSKEEEQLIKDNDKDKIITDFGGKKRTISTNLPWIQDVNPLGSLNPIIKTPLELATNKNFTFGNDIEQYGGQVKEASPIEGLLGGILGQTEIGEDGTKYINAKAKHLITNALPSVRTMDRSFENVTSDDKLGGLMALLGLGGQEFNVDKRTSYEVREYKELLENLEKKAQSMGINTREKLKEKQELERLMKALNIY